jgi:hypothetical protein
MANSYEEMTLDEIFNGKDFYFPGLIPLVYAYLEYVHCDEETFNKVDQYLKFVSAYVKWKVNSEYFFIYTVVSCVGEQVAI